jgi:2-polyprenyl-6-methoxyphenol hydroxylase-like FAD-dependent oxidoreductase
MNIPGQVPVVVVGAGPTGLTLACTLRQAGIEVLVVDQAAEGATTSRAAVVHARTLEALEELDVSRRMVSDGVTVPVFTIHDRDRVLARIDFSTLPTHYPYALMVPQSQTEAILCGRLEELGGRVHRPCRATAVTTTPEGAEVAICGPEGEERSVQAQYVVGADGMHSTVRQAAGIGFSGGRYPESFMLADVEMDWPMPSGEVQLFFSGAGLMVVGPLPGGRYRIVASVEPTSKTISLEAVQALLVARGPATVQVHTVVWGSRFQVHHRVAKRFRNGPLLLAGDAAHVHSPAGGQGMNLGIQDAVDLGHTVIDVLKNGRNESSLDAYQQRRRPVAKSVVALTDRATKIATLTHPAAGLLRNTAIRGVGRVGFAQHRLARRLAQLE